MSQTKAREDYLKAIYDLSWDKKKVTTRDLARRLGVQSPSVTGMLKNLAREKLVVHTPRYGAILTPAGRAEALGLRRRHGLIELFLNKTFKMDMAQVHMEAEALEHHVSEELVELIDAHLGRPRFCPNGEPIPDMDGLLPENNGMPIADLKPRQKATICEVLDLYPAQVARWQELGLVPGAQIWIDEDRAIDGVVVIHVNGQKVPLTWNALNGLKVALVAAPNGISNKQRRSK